MRTYLLTALLLATGTPLLKAQQGNFFMKIENITSNGPSRTTLNNNLTVYAFRDSADYVSHIVGPNGRATGEHFKHHFATKIPVDALTQELQKALEEGAHLGKIELTYTGRGYTGNVPKFVVTISDPAVTSFKLFTSDNNPTLYAELTFTGTNVTYTYQGQATNGGPIRQPASRTSPSGNQPGK